MVADPGTPCPYFSAFFDFNSTGRRFITNRAHGALGFALSAAVGAAYGAPSSKIVAVMGDGSFGFTVGELETVVRKDLPITFVVFSNLSYGSIKASQNSGYGERYFSVDFTRSDHARFAEAYGLKTWSVRDPGGTPCDHARRDRVRQADARRCPVPAARAVCRAGQSLDGLTGVDPGRLFQ